MMTHLEVPADLRPVLHDLAFLYQQDGLAGVAAVIRSRALRLHCRMDLAEGDLPGAAAAEITAGKLYDDVDAYAVAGALLAAEIDRLAARTVT